MGRPNSKENWGWRCILNYLRPENGVKPAKALRFAPVVVSLLRDFGRNGKTELPITKKIGDGDAY